MLQRLLVGAAALGLAAVAAALPEASPAPSPAASLVGEWVLVSDDAIPQNVPIPDERWTFTADGKWKLSRKDDPQEGRYKLQSDELVLVSEVDGTTRVLRRGYKVEGDDLQLSNKSEGYSRYKRVK